MKLHVKLSTSDMAALLTQGKQERYLAIPPKLTYEEVIKYVNQYRSNSEAISGIYQFSWVSGTYSRKVDIV